MEKFQNKYDEMIDILSKRNKISSEYLNLYADKTLLELMNQQTRITLETQNQHFNDILQLDFTKVSNDVFEIHYHKQSVIYPFLNEIILNMSSPDELRGNPFDFLNHKTIIFEYGRFFDINSFIVEYLTPFFYDKILSMIATDLNENQIINLLSEYKERVLSNIYCFSYFSLPELLLKLQNLPYVITQLREVGLVILDSPNLLLSEDIKLSHISDKDGNLTSHINLKKRKGTSQKNNGWYETINILLNNFRAEFNFNLIYTFYDYKRVESLNHIKYKMNDQNFIFDNNSKYFKIKIGEEDRLQIIFSSNSFVEDKQKLYFLETESSYYNLDINIFGIVNYLGESKFKFTIFGKKKGVSESKFMYSQIFVQEKTSRQSLNNSININN